MSVGSTQGERREGKELDARKAKKGEKMGRNLDAKEEEEKGEDGRECEGKEPGCEEGRKTGRGWEEVRGWNPDEMLAEGGGKEERK